MGCAVRSYSPFLTYHLGRLPYLVDLEGVGFTYLNFGFITIVMNILPRKIHVAGVVFYVW